MIKIVSKFILIIAFLVAAFPAIGQEADTTNISKDTLLTLQPLDTVPVEFDTIHLGFKQVLILTDTVYSGIEDSIIIIEKSADRLLTKNTLLRKKEYYERNPKQKEFMLKASDEARKLFMDEVINNKVKAPTTFSLSDSYFEEHEGKVIKEILYNQVDILDGDVFYTPQDSTTNFGEFLNKTFSATKRMVIKGYVRFKENETVDARVFSDNERLLRKLSYIEDAKIYVVPEENSPDSVKVVVVTKDKYPFGVGGSIRDYDYFRLEPYTRNFMGWGHRFGLDFMYKGNEDQEFGYGFNYQANNIMGSFTDAEIMYMNDYKAELFYSRIEKPFITTDTRFGGEVAYEIRAAERKSLIFEPDSIVESEDFFKSHIFDGWAGYSIFFHRDIKNAFLNVAARYYNERYKERPDIDPEQNFTFHSKRMVLGGLTYQKVSFAETSKLLGFGVVEYVPIGFNINLTAGWQESSFYKRPYGAFGLNYSMLSEKAGLMSGQLEFGAHYRDSEMEDGMAKITLNYYSPLRRIRLMEFRNVLSVVATSVMDPLLFDRVTFNRSLKGLDKADVYGYSTLVLRYQPIFHLPFEFMRFRFAIRPFVDLAWISEKSFLGSPNKFYSVYGIGTSLKNESLVFPAMHLYMGMKPDWSDGGYKFGIQVKFTDYKVLNFFSELKPRVIRPNTIYRF